MKAIAAVTQGLDEYMILKTGCSDKDDNLCEQMVDYGKTPEKYESIESVHISGKLSADLKEGSTKPVFRPNGNGNVGYTVFRIDKEYKEGRKIPVYEYDLLTTIPSNGSDFSFIYTPTFYDDEISLKFITSTSNNEGCQVSTPTSTPVRTATEKPQLGSLESGLIAALVVIVVVIALLIGAYFLRTRKLLS